MKLEHFLLTLSNRHENLANMKIVIALVCLMALAAAVEETDIVVETADLDVAEHRRPGGYYGGYRGGHGRYRGGYHGHYGWGRKRRSVEDDAVVADLETAEHRRGGYGGRRHHSGHRGGHGGHRGYGSFGHHG